MGQHFIHIALPMHYNSYQYANHDIIMILNKNLNQYNDNKEENALNEKQKPNEIEANRSNIKDANRSMDNIYLLKQSKLNSNSIQLNPNNNKFQENYIKALFNNGKQSKALKYCEQLISLHPNNDRFSFCWYDLAEYKRALDLFKKCVELKPNDTYYISDYAMFLWNLNELKKASMVLCDLGHVYEKKSKNPLQCKVNMSYAYLLYLKTDNKSLKIFKIALNIDGQNPWLHYWYGLLLKNVLKRMISLLCDSLKCMISIHWLL